MSWQRLEQVIKWTGLNINAFSLSLGDKRSENIYRITRNKLNITSKLANKIVSQYPQINRDWLLFGDGEMKNNVEVPTFKNNAPIPYYDKALFRFNMNIPLFANVEKAVTVNDYAMSPLIPYGAVAMLRQQQFIIFGQIYLIETEQLAIVRIVRKCFTSDNRVILEATDSSRYDQMVIPANSIVRFSLVCGVIVQFI